MLAVGQKAPLTIQLHDDSGSDVSLHDLLGSYVVLYFYPKDDTPGCTIEACDFRDAQSDFQKMGVKVIGVSKDPLASHQKFKANHRLNFPLWMDTEHELAEAFGIWVEKSFMGKKYMGMERSTFVIDPKGLIVKVWPKVNSLGHAQEVLAAVTQLQS